MLYFEEANVEQHESIIFLHGGSGSHREWKKVAGQESLASYHHILVDLPGHSGSKHIQFTSLKSTADELRKVILDRAHGGKAHVVGFSLGGFAALVLTSTWPDVILSTFVSGAFPYKGVFKWVMKRPRLMGLINSVENLAVVRAVALRMQGIDGEDWGAEKDKDNNLDGNIITQELGNFSMDDAYAISESGIRTCVIAGGKVDQVEAVKEMATVLREGGKKRGIQNEGAVVRDAYHPWHLQLPVLFAAGIEAWVQGKDLPKEFEIL